MAAVLGEQEARLQALLVCPRCRGPLAWEPGQARCHACRRRYPVNDGIPEMDPGEPF
ncbi:MAG: Trm112 family protein [Myxococcaceae bacterium]